MIETGEQFDNKIVYMTGTIEKPVVTRVLEIDADNETDVDVERRKIYEAERRGIQPTVGGIRRFYYPTDYGYRQYQQRSDYKIEYNNNQLGTERGRGGKTTRGVKEILFDEEGNEISRKYSRIIGSGCKVLPFEGRDARVSK